MPGATQWNLDLINALFCEADVKAIMSIPPCLGHDAWHSNETGEYTVKSSYRVATEVICSNEEYRKSGNWSKLWKIEVPHKVRCFLWRVARNCLPNRRNLSRKGIHVPIHCVLCGLDIENSWHQFISCPFAQNCWQEANIHVLQLANNKEGFAGLLFRVLTTCDLSFASRFAMIVWGIWRQRNDKLCSNTHHSPSQTVFSPLNVLCDWLKAKELRQPVSNSSMIAGVCTGWHKPPISFVKYNSDAAIFPDIQAAGFGCVVRDADGRFLASLMSRFDGLPCVKECEALALLEAVQWVRSLSFERALFEVDAKVVVDALHSSQLDQSELGSIVDHCRDLLLSGNTYSVSYIRRQANEMAHTLARASRSQACPVFHFDLPSCLPTSLSNTCSIDGH